MIFTATIGRLRREIATPALRRNLLRICSRQPRTIHQLIHAPDYPGIDVDLFSLQSEISVTIELGECKNGGLLVRVGRVPDPIVRGGRTELLRTSLLAFLVSPELARAEPDAYWWYLAAWLQRVGADQLGAGDWETLGAVWARFPELAHRGFSAGDQRAPVADEYFSGDPRRVFGCYHIQDLPLRPARLTWQEAWRAVRKGPLAAGPVDLPPARSVIRQFGRPAGALIAAAARLHPHSRRHGHRPQVAAVAGPEFLAGRLLPNPPLRRRRRRRAGGQVG
ncbi:MAG: hypothetical protein ACP5G2_05130 [Candidatus Bipolaricaulaceae bacterium]